MKQAYLILSAYILVNTCIFSQNKFFLGFDLLGRNAEHYHYLKFTPFSPKISDIEDISLFSTDLYGTINYSVYLKYKQNKYLTWSIGYETFLLEDKLPLRAHLFCDNCVNIFGFSREQYSRNFPVHLELQLPLCKSLRKLKIVPLIGFNLIYNEPEVHDISYVNEANSYRHFSTEYALNNIEATFDPIRHWNIGLRYGAGLEFNIYKEIRLNLTFLAQYGLYEVNRTSFKIMHLDLLFNENKIDEGLWVNKQSFFSKRLGIVFPMDWAYRKIKANPLKKIFAK